jgi:hypothetical protein
MWYFIDDHATPLSTGEKLCVTMEANGLEASQDGFCVAND